MKNIRQNIGSKRVNSNARKTKRTYPGATVARPLVEWLNAAKEAKEKDNRLAGESLQQVLTFLLEISEFTRQRSQLNRVLKEGTAKKKMVLLAADREFDLQDKLTTVLARYDFSAAVYSPHNLQLRGRLRFDARSFACDFGSAVYPGGFHEADAVLLVFQLAQQGYISNVRPCSHCHSFFYSSKRNQRFCPPPRCCRFHYWNTPEAREARRVAAKNQRNNERDDEIKYLAKEGGRKPKRRV